MKRKYNIFDMPIARRVKKDIQYEYQIIHNYCKEIAIAKSINSTSVTINIMELLDVAIHRWNLHHNTKLAYYTVNGGVVLHNNSGAEIRYIFDIEKR